METIVFVSCQKELVEDLNITVEMGFGKYPYSLICFDTLNDIDKNIASIKPDLVVLSYDAMSKRDAWSFGDIPIAYHAIDRDELNEGAKYGFPTIGIASDSETLAEKLSEKPYSAGKYTKKTTKAKQKVEDDVDDDEFEEQPKEQPKRQIKQRQQVKKQQAQKQQIKQKQSPEPNVIEEIPNNDEDDYEQDDIIEELNDLNEDDFEEYDDFEENEDIGDDEDDSFDDDEIEDIPEDDIEDIEDDDEDDDIEEERPLRKSSDSRQKSHIHVQNVKPAQQQKKQDARQKIQQQTASRPIKTQQSTKRQQTVKSQQTVKQPIRKTKPEKPAEKKGKNTDYINQEFQKDLIKDKAETKVVTVYSAKGGVGKTTIATELATYLSLVSIGRRKLRICLVDYNIDFGDVRMTLNLNSRNMNLTDWAGEVQEYLDNGQNGDDIDYSKDEIKEFMTVDKKSGLSILQAPLTNEDSMNISSESLSIILRNIMENGGYDYVICDTGNNTRDSTMIALENADIILMIMTQNTNTANCDKAFMDTMEAINFDLSNTKLVINNIMPQKSTKISVQEIVDFFPFECIGKLKFNTDVIKATNMAEPLAYQPDHEFTKQLRSIVTYILKQDDYTVDVKPKKKLFGFLHKDK